MAERTVSIVGDRVRRPSHPWRPTAHAVLGHLRASGVSGVPAPLVLNSRYEEVSLLPGEAGAACWPHQATEAGLRSAARLLRRVHDATADWDPPPDAIWGIEPIEPSEIICHGDPGPWNMVWVDGRAVGLFDWDFCHPGPRREDVAYALEYLTPFRDDVEALRSLAFPGPPDRPRRLTVFCEEYGIDSDGVVDAVIDLQRRVGERVSALADAGVEPQATWVAQGFLDELAARAAWSEQHRHVIT